MLDYFAIDATCLLPSRAAKGPNADTLQEKHRDVI